MVTTKCPECQVEIQLRPEGLGADSVSYYCSRCEKPVRLLLEDVEDDVVLAGGQAGPSPEGRPLKVVIVDDTRTVTKLAASLLRNQGYTVFVAEDGETCLDLIRREKPDLVLLDLVLPGMSGFDVLRVLRDEDEPKPMVLVTSGEIRAPEDISKAHALGAVGFIPKALLRDTLLFRIESLLQ